MPRTEAGRSLYADAEDYGGEVYYGDMAEWARRIDAIEAEARNDDGLGAKHWARVGASAERARIRAAVEGLADSEWRECGGACHDHTIAAVLRIIDGDDA